MPVHTLLRLAATVVLFGPMTFAAPILANATPVATIDGFNFDLGQFSSAFVTTDGDFASSQFDNAAGVDGFELGELASRPGGSTFPNDTGDRISLGNDTIEQFLKLDYGSNPFNLTSGQGTNFVVYESSGRATPDPEGVNFKISFNGQAFVNANIIAAAMATIVDVDGAGGAASHNQVVFDLTGALFGFGIGDQISTVEIRNLIGFGSTSDPDFTFAGFAGASVNPVPLPAALPLFSTGLAIMGFLGWRRKRKVA